MVDWNLAVATATRLVRPGPEISREEAREVVAELRRHAKAAEEHVRSFTRMIPEGTEPEDTPVLVVDRAGWIKANVAGFRELLRPLLGKMQDRRAGGPGGAVLGAVGGKVTGVEVGMLLSFLASRVLGQYETFAPATREPPRLGRRRRPAAARRPEHRARRARTGRRPARLPALGRAPRGDPPHPVHRGALAPRPSAGRDPVIPRRDRHRPDDRAGTAPRGRPVPCRGAPRGRGGRGRRPQPGRTRPDARPARDPRPAHRRDVPARRPRRLRDGRRRPGGGLLRRRDPGEVPAAQGTRRGRLDQALRKLLGLDAKLRQYRDGERFVRAVVDEVGMDGFNRVWTSPNTLPTKAEIAKPADWIARVHRKAES